jgi:Flp pilus assembly protein TadD
VRLVAEVGHAICYWELGRVDEARADWQRVIELPGQERNDVARLGVATCDYVKGRKDKAFSLARTLISENPGITEQLDTWSDRFGRTDELSEAAREQCRAVRPDDGDTPREERR